MRRIEEGAVSAVVDVELVAAALLDAYQHARIFRAQRPARLAPELGRIADRQAFEGLVDHLEIGLERRRLHARIDGRKAPADIDDDDRHGRLDDGRAHAMQRLRIGRRRHRLAAYMERSEERSVGTEWVST